MADHMHDSVTDLLEEENEEEKCFCNLANQKAHLLSPGAAFKMVHSATTDTLDSVYLEPAVLEHESDSQEEGANIERQTKDRKSEAETEQQTENRELPIHEHSVAGDVSFSCNGDALHKENSFAPTLSSYFGTEQDGEDDPFATNIVSNVIEDDLKKDTEFNLDQQTVFDQSEVVGEESNELLLDQLINEALNDTNDLACDVSEQVMQKKNVNNIHRPDSSNVESVDFELELNKSEKVETPVDLEEKDDFESFTADVADTEALEALGMSPAATSFMTEKNIKDYFRQTSQTDSLFYIGPQMSQSSARSSIAQDQYFNPDASVELDAHNLGSKSLSTEALESSVPTDETQMNNIKSAFEAKEFGSLVFNTPAHKPIFPPSTTLSPVDSPVHMPSFSAASQISDTEHQSISSVDDGISVFQSFINTIITDDPFATFLQMSDLDRQHDAWLPSDATKRILMTMATHKEGPLMLERDMLCSPSLVIVELQGDPVRDLVYRYMGEQEALKRQALTADKVSQDTDGLKKLMGSGCYRSAIDLTTRLLTSIGQAEAGENPVMHTPETLQLWYCRFSLMMKLRMYSAMESEFVAFHNLDTPDIYYEFYPQIYAGKRGSMAAFGMRLLHAELPHHLGKSQEALDRLYYMLAITQKIVKHLADGLAEDGSAVTISVDSKKVSQELWLKREKQVLYIIGNILVLQRDYDAALTIYEMLLEKDKLHKTALLNGLGRIHLQVGNLTKAMDYFQEVQSSQELDSKASSCMLHMNKGFEAMCRNNFADAYQSFKLAVQADPTNSAAVNNMAVCCLYLGHLKDALKSLEALVHGDPDKNLHEGILFNLCTLYELESSRALHKKQALLDLVSKHKGDGFPVVCLKMA